MSSVSVIIPVKNGERFLEEVLAAVGREGVDETLVIDSGSEDRSVAIARAAGARLIEIPAAEFGHGRTRNLGMEQTTGDLVCLLTQDATPVPGWLAAYREAFTLAPNVGAAYGPHLPRATTSPMIARELTEFFAMFSPEGTPALQCDGGPTFLSNVNACYSRRCWQEIRFPEVGLRGRPGVRGRHARRRLVQGLPARGGGATRSRLRLDGIHAPVFRRIPWVTRDDRSR